MKKIYCLFVAALLITFCQAQKEKLELNLTKGETYSLKIVSSASFDTPAHGKQVKSEGQTYINMKFKVTDIHDDMYDIETKCDSISYKGNLINMVFDFYSRSDTKIPDDNNNIFLKRLYKSLKGMPFQFKMTKAGKVSEVKNMVLDTSKFQLTCNLFYQGFIKSIPAFYPDSEVGKGDKWTINITLPSEMFNSTGTIYELKEVTDNYLLISGRSNIKTTGNEANVGKTNSAIKPDVTSTVTSSIKIDKKTGWIIDAKISQIVKGTMKADPKKPGDKDSYLDVKTEATITNK